MVSFQEYATLYDPNEVPTINKTKGGTSIKSDKLFRAQPPRF